MSLIEWNNALYSVRIAEFDNDHKKLVQLLNELHSAMMKGQGKEKLNLIFQELKAYTEYHFKAEEEKMAANGYPALEEHKKQHHELITKLELLSKDFENGKREISIETFKFLKEWIFNHIQVVDKKYTPYLAGK
jgi:hemerythrin